MVVSVFFRDYIRGFDTSFINDDMEVADTVLGAVVLNGLKFELCYIGFDLYRTRYLGTVFWLSELDFTVRILVVDVFDWPSFLIFSVLGLVRVVLLLIGFVTGIIVCTSCDGRKPK